jgi:hypothetical protein
MADAGVPPTKTSEGDVQASSTNEIDAEEVTVPTNLPSDVGFDYVPLATCLATGQWAEADQVCCLLVDFFLRYQLLSILRYLHSSAPRKKARFFRIPSFSSPYCCISNVH